MVSNHKIISYNVQSNFQLSGLHQLISIHRALLVFLQEVTINSSQLNTLLGPSYKGECNLDICDSKRPGTAIIWRTGLEVEVSNIVTCRIQLLKLWDFSFLKCLCLQGGTQPPNI